MKHSSSEIAGFSRIRWSSCSWECRSTHGRIRGHDVGTRKARALRSPTKELETLEKVTEKVDKLTVFSGLDGVLKDVVRIQVPAN